MGRTLRRAQELARKDAEIAEQKQKMEDMAVEFGEMLKETLDKARAPAAPPPHERARAAPPHASKAPRDGGSGAPTCSALRVPRRGGAAESAHSHHRRARTSARPLSR